MLQLSNLDENSLLILNAISNTTLPIIVEGKIGTGKSTIAQIISELGLKRLCDPARENEEDVMFLKKLEELVLDNENINNVILVSYPGKTDWVESEIGKHIKLKTFRPGDGTNQYIHLSMEICANSRVDLTIKELNPATFYRGYNVMEVEKAVSKSGKKVHMIINELTGLNTVQRILDGRLTEMGLSRAKTYKDIGLNEMVFIIDLGDFETGENIIRSLCASCRSVGFKLMLVSDGNSLHEHLADSCTQLVEKPSTGSTIRIIGNEEFKNMMLDSRNMKESVSYFSANLDIKDVYKIMLKQLNSDIKYVINYHIMRYDITTSCKLLETAQNLGLSVDIYNESGFGIPMSILNFVDVEASICKESEYECIYFRDSKDLEVLPTNSIKVLKVDSDMLIDLYEECVYHIEYKSEMNKDLRFLIPVDVANKHVGYMKLLIDNREFLRHHIVIYNVNNIELDSELKLLVKVVDRLTNQEEY